MKDPHFASKILEIESIIETAVLSAHASLARQESRWGFWHYRSDFPERDDAHWVKHLILSKGSDAFEPRVSIRDIDTLPIQAEAWNYAQAAR